MSSTKNFLLITLSTDRLRLSPVRLVDAQDIFKEFRGNVVSYQDVWPCKSLDEQKGWVEKNIADAKDGKAVQLIISDKQSNAFLGKCVLKKADTLTPELGIWIKESAQGSGYAEESVRCLLEWAKENLQCEYIKALVDVRNTNSIHLFEKLGGKRARAFAFETEERGTLQVYEYRLQHHQSSHSDLSR